MTERETIATEWEQQAIARAREAQAYEQGYITGWNLGLAEGYRRATGRLLPPRFQAFIILLWFIVGLGIGASAAIGLR